mgnify:CR=1 FL=1
MYGSHSFYPGACSRIYERPDTYHALESQELEEHLHRQIVNIQDINESNVRVKEVMEQQLIDHKDSIGKIYSITAGLEQRMPDEVIFYAVEMLGKLMKTKDVALYNVVSKDYARIFSASSQKARSLGNSIRYREMTDIYDALKEQKVYINKKMDEQYPLMARGIYEGEEVQMIVMMWGLSWEKMTLGQANFLTVVSYLTSECSPQGTEIYAGDWKRSVIARIPESWNRKHLSPWFRHI